MAEKLTPQQAEAVHNRGGKLLVSAAAGSGKTKVLVDRLLSYIMDPADPANMDDFLIITYTKAAASELRGKIAAKLTERIAQDPENKHLQRQMQRLFLSKISTVHGFCSDILREYAYRMDLPADFRVADELECLELREQVLVQILDKAYETAWENDAFRAFVDTQGLGRDDRLVPEIILSVYDSARCHLDPEQWLHSCMENVAAEDIEDPAKTPWGQYLMGELFVCLDSLIAMLGTAVSKLEQIPEFAKPTVSVTAVLHQLRYLRSSNTWDDVVTRKNVDYGRLTWPRKHTEPDMVDQVKAAWKFCKITLEKKTRPFADNSSEVLRDICNAAEGTRGLVDLVRVFSKEYDRMKRSRRVLDFGDLEHRTLDLLLGKRRDVPTAAAREIGKRFREVLVDEYQDSNAVQDAIFSALTEEKQNCFLVGDVKQSIYQFRLADPGIFLQKYQAYPDAETAQPLQGRKVLLSHNFRSGPEVVEAVNAVFSCCMHDRVGGMLYGEAEALREGIPHKRFQDAAIELHCIDTNGDSYTEEADFTASHIHDMLCDGTVIRDGEGFRQVQPEDIVILLRSPGSTALYFQRALEQRGIRCVSGNGTDLFDTEEIGTFYSLLQTIANPRVDIPLLSVLASPVFGITADDLAEMRSHRRYGCVYDAMLLSNQPKVQHFLAVLSQLRQESKMLSLSELLGSVLTLTKLDSIYAAMSGGEIRAKNLQAFYQLAVDFENGSRRELLQFLDHLKMLQGKGLTATEESGAGCVTVMSIHKSKGLEFPVVFLCGLSRGFNRENLRAQVLCDRDLGIGLSAADAGRRIRYPTMAKRSIQTKATTESMSEELRVLYVAMTRARDRLIMSYAPRSLQGKLSEIANLLDLAGPHTLAQEVSSPGDWVLIHAMSRVEAGALHALGGRPEKLTVSEIPWKICIHESSVQTEQTAGITQTPYSLPEGIVDRLEEALRFRYPYLPATVTPSKQTATQIKGRQKDQEAAENTQEPAVFNRIWRKPAFLEQKASGKTYGTAMHAALQYIRYEACSSVEGVDMELKRLMEEGLLSAEQAELVNRHAIADFFQTEIGKKLQKGVPHVREFKFSVLDDSSRLEPQLAGEWVLLQGVVDCAIMEPDGITVLDFKSDRVTEESLMQAADNYSPQIRTYAESLQRIWKMPVKAKYLYFFHVGTFVEVE